MGRLQGMRDTQKKFEAEVEEVKKEIREKMHSLMMSVLNREEEMLEEVEHRKTTELKPLIAEKEGLELSLVSLRSTSDMSQSLLSSVVR